MADYPSSIFFHNCCQTSALLSYVSPSTNPASTCNLWLRSLEVLFHLSQSFCMLNTSAEAMRSKPSLVTSQMWVVGKNFNWFLKDKIWFSQNDPKKKLSLWKMSRGATLVRLFLFLYFRAGSIHHCGYHCLKPNRISLAPWRGGWARTPKHISEKLIHLHNVASQSLVLCYFSFRASW